jgi:murein DD-endopeptidase MepM/ murein hydrolase activator NlpD
MGTRHVVVGFRGHPGPAAGLEGQARARRLLLGGLSLCLVLALVAPGPAAEAGRHPLARARHDEGRMAAGTADPLARAQRLARRVAARAADVRGTVERLRKLRKRLARQVRRAERTVAVVETPWFVELAMRRGVADRRLADARRLLRRLERRRRALLRRVRRLELARLDRLALVQDLVLCPVDRPHWFVDDFGVVSPRDEDGDGQVEEGEARVHQGIDIFAPEGTPVRAPFSGVAVDATNPLGGLAVKVYGPRGYVYNAHLSRIERLGPVRVGDVIGYVGDTGNALGTSPHNHFEWHPWNGPAVDPYRSLAQVC